ncbi:Protein transport protein S9 plasma membrane t-SNARE [Xylographa carneopallida]|nr:Protein transport protein S9 plasma membrane t-SNARE [Xylographa carneopallida]
MRKFGFGKKADNDDDANRSALFGSKSKSKSPAPSANPYAQPSLHPDPYTQAKQKVYAPPEKTGYAIQDRGNDRYGGDNKTGMSDPYGNSNGNGNRYGAAPGGSNGGGYGADRYGAQGGYGADRYGTKAAAPAQTGGSRYGAGGYGGLGGMSAYDENADDNRDALFGGAKDRLQQKKPSQSSYGQPPPYEEGGQASNYPDTSSSSSNPYGTHQQDHQLSAEDEEEAEISATKQQIRFLKQEDVSATRNALRIAAEAEETGRDTLARLGAQGEHIHNTEKNLDLAHNANRAAEDKAAELKKLNRSMFAVHVANPFTAGQRAASRDQAVIDRHLDERDAREATRRAAYQQNQRLQHNFGALGQPGGTGGTAQRGKNLADRAKYQFEADSEDDEMEDEIDRNLDLLGGAAGRLNALARATGQEVDEQNRLLDRIADKSDRVDIGIASNRAKLDRIGR